MGRGAGSAFGLDRMVGCISKNASRSVRNSAWSAMPDSVENICWMLVLACRIAPARKYNVPMRKSPGHRPPDDPDIGRVVTQRADDRQQRPGNQLAPRERHVLFVDFVRQSA